MLLRFFFPLFLCALVAGIATPARAQNEQTDKQITDDFTRTRGADFAPETTPGKPKRKPAPPKPKPKMPLPSKTHNTGNTIPVVDEDAKPKAVTVVEPVNPFRIGLGYTIYRYESDNELAAVEPATVFKENDQLLVELETNADGYLYIFNATNDRNPEMLYPHETLDGGLNHINAHTRINIPADPTNVYTIDDKPGTERLYIIFSRKPLADVPTGEELNKLCVISPDNDCNWHPDAQWEKIKTLGSDAPVVRATNHELKRVRKEALTRGIKIKPRAHIPSVILMSASPTADVMLTTIDLIHK